MWLYLTPTPETAVYCIPATVQRKGPRFPGNVCPEWKMRTKKEEEETEEEEEGSRRGSLVEGDPATEDWTGERAKGRLDPPGWPPMPAEARGWGPWLAVTSSTASYRRYSCGCTRRTTPVYLLGSVLTREPIILVSLLVIMFYCWKSERRVFAVTQWRPALERRGGKQTYKQKRKDARDANFWI